MIEARQTPPTPAAPAAGAFGDSALRFEQVSARYPRASYFALQHVSLDVGPGELSVLLGPNGSGKSTLLRLAAGLLVPAQGRVCVGGRDLRHLDRRRLARLVAFVPQSEAVAFGFRVRDVVAMGRAPHQDGWLREGREDRDAIEEALVMCDLVRLAATRVEELSGGEQRRVAVARALAQRSRVLLLDEPAAFLDVGHRLDLHDLLAKVSRRDGLACVVAMHELDAAARLASQILLLRDGRVIASGPAHAVMTPALLRDAFDVRVDVSVHADTGRQHYFVVGR